MKKPYGYRIDGSKGILVDVAAMEINSLRPRADENRSELISRTRRSRGSS